MTVNSNVTSIAVLGTTGVDQATTSGITPEVLNNLVFLGMTFGAWVTSILGLGALAVLIYNTINIVSKVQDLLEKRSRHRRKTSLKKTTSTKSNMTSDASE